MSLKDANKALLDGDFSAACLLYWGHKVSLGLGSPSLDFNLEILRRRWLRSRQGEPLKVIVAAWEVGHNSDGRAMTLAEVWLTPAEVAPIGCRILSSIGRASW